ncbi:hypothetical protein [Kocuria palustris]|uniref:hypothetical protein n=1 Tax=Kocuria palustris TaxID=71999 RepID=UPI0011A2E12E|nr:hypothetical protein [Kocuria palustris]
MSVRRSTRIITASLPLLVLGAADRPGVERGAQRLVPALLAAGSLVGGLALLRRAAGARRI